MKNQENNIIQRLRNDINELEECVKEFEAIVQQLKNTKNPDRIAILKNIKEKTDAEKLLKDKKSELNIEEATEKARKDTLRNGKYVNPIEIAKEIAKTIAGNGVINLRTNTFEIIEGTFTQDDILKGSRFVSQV